MSALPPGSPPPARGLRQRYDPARGTPLRLGRVWPPRLMVHDLATKGPDGGVIELSAWLMHATTRPIDAWIRGSDEPAVDSEGRTIADLEVDPGHAVIPTSRAPGIGDGLLPEARWQPVPVTVRWSHRFAQDIQTVHWVRKTLFIDLVDGVHRRTFQWYLYLTPHEATLPGPSTRFDDHAHYCWVDDGDVPLVLPGVASSWIEVPAPLGSPKLAPACWVQPSTIEGTGPADVDIVASYPIEPAIPPGVEAVGWNGALGGHDPRPATQALAVRTTQLAGAWSTRLYAWDVGADGRGRAVASQRAAVLEDPTSCVWPTIHCRDEHDLVLYDLLAGAGREVTVNFRVGLPPDAEALRLDHGELRVGGQLVGVWREGPVVLSAGQTRNLRCRVDVPAFAHAAEGRLKLTLSFVGRPTRGLVPPSQVFRTEGGPHARVSRARSAAVDAPWLSIDLGTDGTCASVSFMDDCAPRVVTVHFEDGPIYPSRVYLSPALGGVYTLADEPTDDAIYTTLIKLGLRFGDGAHPGCPDHIAATEVARFFLKRFLLEVRERVAWFPLHDADVLVSFPPRLAAMPRFVRSLRETFTSVLAEVVWRPDRPRRLVFREEGFLVAVPALARDLELATGVPKSRYYWVMDFGGGTTDVCGFLCAPDVHGETYVVREMTYPQRLAHHLSGNDVTRAFYRLLYAELAAAEVVAGPNDPARAQGAPRKFPIPPEPFPTARATPDALQNQTALRELSEAIKRLPLEQWNFTTVRTLAKTLPAIGLRTVEGQNATLPGLLGNEAAQLGQRTVASVHARVLDPDAVAARVEDPSHPAGRAAVQCSACAAENPLPRWVFASARTFRFRCRSCGHPQRAAHGRETPWVGGVDEETPLITAYRDTTVQPPAAELVADVYLDQDGRTYVVRDIATLRRWVEERRVGGDDLLSDGKGGWAPLKDRPELADLFRTAEVIAVDITQEVPRNHYREMVYPEPQQVAEVGERPALGRDMRLFLAACRDALDRAVADLPDPANTDVTVLVAGRASLYPPIAEGVRAFFTGRVVHLTNDWVRRNFGGGGPIDLSADLKTMTVNGAGLFALTHSHPEQSAFTLAFDTLRMDCPVYLQSVAASRPWLLTTRLDLRPGHAMELVREARDPVLEVDDAITMVGEPPARPLPHRTAVTGELQLVVDGLPEDRGWEPYVAIAQGVARRRRGRRARTLPETLLIAHARGFELGPLTDEQSVIFHRMLPDLPLLGGTVPVRGPFAEPAAPSADPTSTELRTDEASAFDDEELP